MKLEELIAQVEKNLKEKYGWKLPFVKLWWRIEDLYYETVLYDIVWWITDGKPQWSDAEPCERKLCCKCGNKPWTKYPDQSNTSSK